MLRRSPTRSGTRPPGVTSTRHEDRRGLSNAEIASELFLSVPTVKAHIGRLFAKLEVDNRVQIALCVHDSGMASD
jgi:DNA-binding NarL/FixJ family response regulator